MTFHWHFTRKKDIDHIMRKLDNELICAHPKTPCDKCELEETCAFYAALYKEINTERKRLCHQ